jgi:hypothetical protein
VRPVDKPLALGEVFAETVRIYGERRWAAFGLGAVVAAVFILSGYVPVAVAVALLAVAFTTSWALATRLATGDAFVEACAHLARSAPALVVFTLVASVPFALAISQAFLIVFAVAWLALVGFSIPVSVAERPPGDGSPFGRIAFALHRSLELARAEYLHAAGVVAALVVVYVVVGYVLAAALAGFADNSGLAAVALVQVVLAPFFFLGLAVLYFEQRARLESGRARRERD